MFSTSALKESWASAYYWRCLLVMIGWSIWWSSISERSLPKLWILMTSSIFSWGCQLNESKSLNKYSNSITYWNSKIKYTLDISLFLGQILAPPLPLMIGNRFIKLSKGLEGVGTSVTVCLFFQNFKRVANTTILWVMKSIMDDVQICKYWQMLSSMCDTTINWL